MGGFFRSFPTKFYFAGNIARQSHGIKSGMEWLVIGVV
jgi:hypothetical protein